MGIIYKNGIKYSGGDSYIVEDKSLIPVIGTQTSSTGSWTGNIDIPHLYNGLTIAYFLPYAPSGNVTLNLTLSDGTTTGPINCYYNTGRLTTHYDKGSNIIMTFWGAGSISIDGTPTIDDRWVAQSNYDSNSDTKVRQTLTNGNTNRPILLAYSANTTTTGNVDNISYRDNDFYYNPSTNLLTIPNLSVTKINGVTPVLTDTTYTFTDGTNGFTVTPSGGTAQTVTVTPSIANNITGSGTSGYLAKFNGANTLTNGPQLGSSTTTYLRNDGTWTTPSDKKVKTEYYTPTTDANYFYLAFTSQASTGGLLLNNGIRYAVSTTTLQTYGESLLQLGSENLAHGALRLYSDFGGYGVLTQATTANALSHILPTSGGELVNLSATQTLTNKTLSNCYISTIEKASGDIVVKSTLTFSSGTAIKMADKIAMQIYKENNVNCLAVGIDTMKVTLYGSSYYLSTGAAITSDKRLKTNIEIVDNRYLNLIKNLEPKRFKLKNNPEQKYHTGFIAQDVQELLKKYNINEEEFAAFARPKEDDSEYALSYNEFIPLLLLYIKDLEKQIKELKEQQ